MKQIILLIGILMLSSCRYNKTFSNLKDLKISKENVEKISTEELTVENQKILRTYFSNLKDIIYEFKNNSKMQKYTHRKFSKFYKDSFCDNFIVSEQAYFQILKRCNVSGFYICSEEVRTYKGLLLSAKALLTEKEQDRLNSNQKCEKKLQDLGVVDE